MKHKLQTLLKHKLQWLLLLAALLGVSQNVAAATWACAYVYDWNGSSNSSYKVDDNCNFVSSNAINGKNYGTIGSAFSMKFYVLVNDNTNRTNGRLFYKVDNNGSFTEKTLTADGNYSGNKRYGYDLDIAGLKLSSGNHTITFYLRVPHTDNNWYISNNSNNYSFSFTVPEPTYNWTKDKTLYFVNNTGTHWSNAYLRIGHTSYNDAYSMTQVTGTVDYYSKTITNNDGWSGYVAFVTSNNSGTTGQSNTIYNKGSGGTLIDKSSAYQKVDVSEHKTLTISGSGTTTEGVTYYATNLASGQTKYRVTLGNPSNGNISATYTSDNGGTISKNSYADVLPTSFLTLSATPSSGYALDKFTITDGSGGTRDKNAGDTIIIRSNTTVTASFVASCTKPTTVTPTYDGTPTSKTVALGDAQANVLPQTASKKLSPGASGGSSISYYNWSSTNSDFAVISNSSVEEPNIYFKREGKYTVTSKVGCGSSSGSYTSGTVVVNVLPNELFIVGPLVNSTANPETWDNGEDLTRTYTSDTNISYTRTWVTPWASTATGNKYFGIRSIKNYGGVATSMVGSYAYNSTKSGVTIDDGTNGSGNITPNITYAAGDHLSITVTYKGWNNSQSKPEYTYELTSCTPPTPTTTNAPAAKSYTTATLTGTYPTTSGYCSISEKGICYGADTNPTDKHVDSSSSSGSISMNITGLTPGETYHYRAYVVVDGETYYGADKSFATTACTAPEITTQPYDTQTRRYCINTDTPTTLTVVAIGGVGSYTYQWQEKLKDKSTFSNVATGTGYQTASFTPSNASAGNRYYRCIVTNESVCTSYSATSNESCLYTINRLSDAGTISGDGTYCQGASGDTQTLTLNDYIGSRQWHKSTNPNFTPTNDTKIPSATGITYNAPINNTGTMYYKVVVTNGACQPATSADAAEVTVRPNMSVDDVTLNLSSASVCNGATGVTASISGTPVTTEAGGVGQYQSSNTSVATINTSTGAITTVSAGNTDITYKVTGGCGSTVETLPVELTVKAKPTLTITPAGTIYNYMPMTVSSDMDVATWSWTGSANLIDGYFTSELTRTATFKGKIKNQETTRAVTFTATGTNGCNGTVVQDITKDTENCTQ